MFASPSQILCTVFGVNIYIYGIVLALAIVAGAFVAEYIGERFYGFKKDTIIDMVPSLVIFGIIGARLYYCILNYEFYLKFPTEILALRHGGISIHGAILGGFAGLLIYAHRHKLPLLKLTDITSCALALSQSIGRWGNFFNSEAFGTPTDLPWKLYIAPQYRPIPYNGYEYFHPAFLYESILDFIIFSVLVFIVYKNKNKKDGDIALVYLILYSVARILVETIRIDSVREVFSIPVAIFVSIVIIVLSLIVLTVRHFPKKEIV